MRTRGRSVSIHGGVVPSVAAAALFSFGVSCGAPGGASGPAPGETDRSRAASTAPGHVIDSAVVRLRWRHEASPGSLLVRIDEVRGVDVLPLTLPVRLHHVDGSLEDVLLPMTGQGETCEVRCEQEPVAVSFDPDGALERVTGIEAVPSEGPW